MKINRRFTKPGQNALECVTYEKRTSRISNPDGSVVFEMTDAEIPQNWSQLATDIMVSKYFRKAGVPQMDTDGNPKRDSAGKAILGPEKSAKQVVNRLAGCWRHWGETHGYFDTNEDAQAFYDELCFMLLNQMCAPNSPQWFNTGLNFAYNITGPSQGHFYCDPKTGQLTVSKDAYTHPQPHACFIQSVSDDLVNPGGLMDLWTREARLFKYGSGTGSNFSRVRGENESLSGGGKSSGLMSFLKIGDRAAGAIKSGGTTRRAAKMVCLDLDHPDVEEFINWKVREELKVAALAEGMKRLPKDQQDLASKLKLKLDYDFNGEAYGTVSGQNSNNSVRIPNRFFKAVEEDGDWTLTNRVNGKAAKKIKARHLWEEISFAAWRCADPGVQYDDTINQWHTCPQSGRINASNPCVTGDTRVLCPGGIWRRIDQMIYLPARIVTNLHNKEIHTIEGAFPTGVKEVFELKTVGGYSIKLTADHKVLTRTRGWIPAADLTIQDDVKIPNQHAAVEEIGEPQDARFFQMVGLYLSDANRDATSLNLAAILETPAQLDIFAQYAAETWGAVHYPDDYAIPEMLSDRLPTHPSRDQHQIRQTAIGEVQIGLENLGHVDQPAGTHQSRFEKYDGNLGNTTNDESILRNGSAGQSAGQSSLPDRSGSTMTLALSNRRLISRLRAFVNMENGHRRLSDEAFTAGLAAQKHLLRALFTADAMSIDNTLELRSENVGLLHDLQLILLGFGVQSSVTKLNGTRGVLPYLAESRHGLRINPGSLRLFSQNVGLLTGDKSRRLSRAVAVQYAENPEAKTQSHWDKVASFIPQGEQQVFDLTEPMTSSFVANGITVHNCSEYMFLDDTACNLASLNVMTFFDAENKSFDIDAFKHATRIWTIVLEISVLMASFPSEAIARLSYKYRTLGLGYANLGAMLMQAGIPYNSEKGRAICGAVTAILTGESYAASAEMAHELGAFKGYDENKLDCLRVLRNHRRAAYNVDKDEASRKLIGEFESLDIHPVGINASEFRDSDPLCNRRLLSAARECWDRALKSAERYGLRNAQTTVIAPTGTIGLLMDCDTTGVEPDFALVKFKKLAGGGYFKIANQSLRPSLVNLGYGPQEIHDILAFVMGTLSLDNAPHINRDGLKLAGLTDAELDKIEAALPGVFEIGFAFTSWSIGAEALKRLGISEEESQVPGFNLLAKLGYTRKQISEANDVICGRGTIEGAPYLKAEHLPVFDCANKCGKTGKRFIEAGGHIRMMAAAQPFISGAISKTINLPNEASIEDIKEAYHLSWKLGLKANALYRDGSKLSQPLNIKSDEDADNSTDEDDADNIAAALEEVAADVATGSAVIAGIKSDNLSTTPHTIEKIIERVVERPLRRRLPDTRQAITHKFDVAGHEGYITVGLYEDGAPGEVFITMAKEGSTIGGLMDTVATLVSVALQYGVPVESLVRKFEHVRFEPSGMTRNREIPIAKSLVDYIFRWLAMEFIHGYRAANAPKRSDPKQASASSTAEAKQTASAGNTDISAGTAVDNRLRKDNGNGNGNSGNGNSSNGGSSHSHPMTYSTGIHSAKDAPSDSIPGSINLRLAIVSDPLSQQGSEMQSDAPACDVCGSITVRSGTCYKCMNCGNSMGCS